MAALPKFYSSGVLLVALATIANVGCGRFNFTPSDPDPAAPDAGTPRTCTAAKTDVSTGDVLDVAGWNEDAVILSSDTVGTERVVHVRRASSEAAIGIPVQLGSYQLGNVANARLELDGPMARTCIGVLVDGFASMILFSLDLATGSTNSERLCPAGVHCQNGCRVSSRAGALISARAFEVTSNPPTYHLGLATHDAGGGFLMDTDLPAVGQVVGLADAGARRVVLAKNDQGETVLVAIDTAEQTIYRAVVDAAGFVELSDALWFVRSAGGGIQANAVNADATLGAVALDVVAATSPITTPPSIMRRGSTTWLLWMEGTVAHLGSVDVRGVLTPVRTWLDASGAWLVPTAQDVTVAIGHVRRVTVERVCP